MSNLSCIAFPRAEYVIAVAAVHAARRMALSELVSAESTAYIAIKHSKNAEVEKCVGPCGAVLTANS